MDKVSIITIVYNDKFGLEKTIQSVISQNYSFYEYIVVDGGSSDGSVDVIKKYKDKVDVFVSEKDDGIYHAMNKGIKLSTGKWVNFMNSGDVFYNNQVLSNIFSNSNYNNKAVIYGYKFQDSKPVFPKSLNLLEKGEMICNHQSMFFNSNILGIDLQYSIRFSIYSDYELTNKIYLKFGKDFFKFLNLPVAIYDVNGISSNVSYNKRRDKYLIIFENYGFSGLLKSLIHRVFIDNKYKLNAK